MRYADGKQQHSYDDHPVCSIVSIYLFPSHEDGEARGVCLFTAVVIVVCTIEDNHLLSHHSKDLKHQTSYFITSSYK